MVLNRPRLTDNKRTALAVSQGTMGHYHWRHHCTNLKKSKKLGSLFEDHLNMEPHISSACCSAHFHLHQIAIVRNILDAAWAQAIVNSFCLLTLRLLYLAAIWSSPESATTGPKTTEWGSPSASDPRAKIRANVPPKGPC